MAVYALSNMYPLTAQQKQRNIHVDIAMLRKLVEFFAH